MDDSATASSSFVKDCILSLHISFHQVLMSMSDEPVWTRKQTVQPVSRCCLQPIRNYILRLKASTCWTPRIEYNAWIRTALTPRNSCSSDKSSQLPENSEKVYGDSIILCFRLENGAKRRDANENRQPSPFQYSWDILGLFPPCSVFDTFQHKPVQRNMEWSKLLLFCDKGVRIVTEITTIWETSNTIIVPRSCQESMIDVRKKYRDILRKKASADLIFARSRFVNIHSWIPSSSKGIISVR